MNFLLGNPIFRCEPLVSGRVYLHIYMGVSKKHGTPQIIHFNGVFHYKPFILGYPYFWKHPYIHKISILSSHSSPPKPRHSTWAHLFADNFSPVRRKSQNPCWLQALWENVAEPNNAKKMYELYLKTQITRKISIDVHSLTIHKCICGDCMTSCIFCNWENEAFESTLDVLGCFQEKTHHTDTGWLIWNRLSMDYSTPKGRSESTIPFLKQQHFDNCSSVFGDEHHLRRILLSAGTADNINDSHFVNRDFPSCSFPTFS